MVHDQPIESTSATQPAPMNVPSEARKARMAAPLGRSAAVKLSLQ